jgi:hypothetical protein
MKMKTVTINLPETTIEALLWALGNARAEAGTQTDTALASTTPFASQTVRDLNLWDSRSRAVVRTIDLLHNALALSASQAKEDYEDAQRLAAASAENEKREAANPKVSKRLLDRLAKATEVAEGEAYEAQIAWLRADAHYKSAIATAQGEAK